MHGGEGQYPWNYAHASWAGQLLLIPHYVMTTRELQVTLPFWVLYIYQVVSVAAKDFKVF